MAVKSALKQQRKSLTTQELNYTREKDIGFTLEAKALTYFLNYFNHKMIKIGLT